MNFANFTYKGRKVEINNAENRLNIFVDGNLWASTHDSLSTRAEAIALAKDLINVQSTHWLIRPLLALVLDAARWLHRQITYKPPTNPKNHIK